jgi:glutathione S-transferase
VHPLGQAPVIEDGDVVLAESLAITLYILELYGDGRLRIAPGEGEYANYLCWLTYAIGGLMPKAMQHMAAARMGEDHSPRGAIMRERKLRHLRMIDDRLRANDWLAGDEFTAADIMCHFPFGTMSQFAPLDISDFAGIRKWVERISARAGYQRSLAAAGYTSDPAQAGSR